MASLHVRWLSVLVLGLSVVACGSRQESTKTPTQVAVKVNKDEISVHQVNAQITQLGSIPPERQDEAKRQVVDALIDRQLFIQQARERKLDRDPEVLTAIENARHQILAQAYVQRTLAASIRPSEAEIKAFYDDNPDLFAKRRVYRLQELATDMPPAAADELRRQVSKSRNLNDVAAWLRARGHAVAGNAAVRGAEQVPLASLPLVAAMKDGDMEVFVNEGRVTVLQVVQSQPQPLSEQEAARFIEQYLANIKRDEATRKELARLREAAAIEYVGDYAKPPTPQAGAAAAPKGDQNKDAGAGAATAGAARSLDKGIGGLR